MQALFKKLDSVKAKPHHVRKSIAYGMAGGIALFIGLLWLGVSLATNAYALKDGNFAAAAGIAPAESGGTTAPQSTQLAGAAAALYSGSSQSAHIEIVNAPNPAATSSAATSTVIPF